MVALNRLSAMAVAKNPPGKYADGSGLWFFRRPDGGAQWIFRYTLDEQPHRAENDIDRLLTSKEVCAVLGRSHASLYRDIHAGTIPPPVKIGSSSRWPAGEVRALIEKAKAARDGEVA